MQNTLGWLVLVSVLTSSVARIDVGRGIADITGLAGDGILYGYARLDQDARGVHTRQYARSYIFDDGVNRAVVVVAEVAMISQAVHREVLEKLEERYGYLYTVSNVIMSPTHSHSTPGGYHTYFMYSVPSGGFETPTFRAVVDGIVKSIEMAHGDLQPAHLFLNSGNLTTASVNRSPYSYDQNPEEEKAEYEYTVDVEMTMLRIDNSLGEHMGALSFFPVHTTSMKGTNHLISSDNKGAASQMMERALNGGHFPTKEGDVMTAFIQAAEGDSSPNINHGRCNGTNELCYYRTSTCPGAPMNPQRCLGRGPTGLILENMDDFEDTRIIGELQYIKAQELFDDKGPEMLDTVVDSRFTWVNMSEMEVDVNGTMVQLCRAAMGYSFAAGATDGPGIRPFYQGMLNGLSIIEDLIDGLFPHLRPQWYKDCHRPKPILLPTGMIRLPYGYWQPEIVPVQLVRIADIVLIGIPAETTTMAGRRLCKAVKEVFNLAGEEIKPILLSMANSFTSYLTTEEEYSVQRYEGASVTYGPNTLHAYTDIVTELAAAMVQGAPVDEGEWPPDLRGFPDEARGDTLIDLLTNDLPYGTVLEDVEPSYHRGDIVECVFVAGNPRNNHSDMIDQTFLEVQRSDGDDWIQVYTDAHWETKFYWDSDCHNVRPGNLTGCMTEQTSNATVEWDISVDEEPGTYRLVHHGHARNVEGNIVEYTGISSPFEVLQEPGMVKKMGKRKFVEEPVGEWWNDADDVSAMDNLHMEKLVDILKQIVSQW